MAPGVEDVNLRAVRETARVVAVLVVGITNCSYGSGVNVRASPFGERKIIGLVRFKP
jgi:hypothetical protein